MNFKITRLLLSPVFVNSKTKNFFDFSNNIYGFLIFQKNRHIKVKCLKDQPLTFFGVILVTTKNFGRNRFNSFGVYWTQTERQIAKQNMCIQKKKCWIH